MKNINLILPINISLNIIVLASILNLHSINSLKFFPIQNAKEDKSFNNSFLTFTIKGVVDSNINNNINFSIEIKLYKDNELISEKNNEIALFQKTLVLYLVPKLFQNVKLIYFIFH